jgi:hypothetical protein
MENSEFVIQRMQTPRFDARLMQFVNSIGNALAN